MQSLDDIRNVLRLDDATPFPDYMTLLADLAEHKKAAITASNQGLSKRIWCFEETISTHQLFIAAYNRLQKRDYYETWCILEEIELALGRLRPHFAEGWQHYRLAFIEKITLGVQSIFPYKIFISPELLEETRACSICGKTVTIRHPCGHCVGEIYDGEYCYRVVTKFSVLGTAMVKDPVQKYSVPFLVDPKTGERRDQYDYSILDYLAKRWPSPLVDWNVEWTKRLHPKSKFGPVGRNDQCPCESGRKYKKCCMPLNGIMRPHVEFHFLYDLPANLQNTEYNY